MFATTEYFNKIENIGHNIFKDNIFAMSLHILMHTSTLNVKPEYTVRFGYGADDDVVFMEEYLTI